MRRLDPDAEETKPEGVVRRARPARPVRDGAGNDGRTRVDREPAGPAWLPRAIDHAPVGLAVVDADGAVLEANAPLRALVGDPQDGNGLRQWMAEDEWSQVHDAIQDAVEPPHAAAGFDVRLRLGDVEQWTHVHLAPTRAGQRWAAVLVLEPAQTPDAVGEHQARSWRREVLQWGAEDQADPATPLLEGLSALRIGAWGPVSPEQQQRIAGLEVFGRRLELLLYEVRSAAAIARGSFRVSPVEDDLRAVVHRAAAVFRDAADDAGIEFQVRAQEPMPCRLDPARIRHVLETLLENAMRFTAAGGLVAVEARPASGGGYEVVVEDEGPGLDAAQRRILWEPFAQVHGDGPGGPGGGIGLGLFVARHAVQAHGGALTVDADPGRGCRFTLRLPA